MTTETRTDNADPADPPPPELYHVAVACDDEAQQRAVYEHLRGQGYTCRLLTL